MSFLTQDWDALKNILGGDGEYDSDNTKATATLGSHLGALSAIFGGITSAVGTYYAAKSAQSQLKSQSMNFQFQSDMAAINARSAENDAQSILEAGKTQVQQYTLRAGQEKAATTASTAARGVTLGVGSAREIAASQDIVKDMDVMTINSNATRAAFAQRTRATNYKNESLLDNVSSQNATRSAASINPKGSAFTSLLGSASSIASQWDWRRKLPSLVAQGGYY